MEHNLLYPKGSIWRKWDLHIHSDSGSPEQIVEKILIEEISVFSITDHCCVNRIDNYLELVKKKQKENKEIHFLPGVELRTDKGKKSVHIIGIFPLIDLTGNEINSDYLKQNLLSKIDCSDSDIKNAGKEALGDGKDEKQYLKRGYTEISVNFEKAAEKIKELGGIVIVHGGTKGSGIETEMDHSDTDKEHEILNSLGHTKRKLMKEHISVCELPNWNASNLIERDFYLKTFNKPSIVCSDSHKLAVLGTKFTWIKADPTFEGLKQILYEPDMRIISGEKEEKYLYPQIHSIQLKGIGEYQTKRDKIDFPPINLNEKILFNPNLTNIIGPRASGKTVLVELLSFPFDKHLKKAIRDEKLSLIPYLARRFPDLSVLVTFQQGEQKPNVIERKIDDWKDPLYAPPLHIEYWHQGEIEDVADKKTKITEYMDDRLRSSHLEDLSQNIDKLKAKLKNLRDRYLNKFETEIEKRRFIAEKKQIEAYFEKLKTREYQDIVKEIRENRSKNQTLKSFITSLEITIESLESSKQKISFNETPNKNTILKLFSENSPLQREIDNLYQFTESNFEKYIERFKKLKQLIKESEELKNLGEEEQKFKKEFFEYCEKNGIKINQAEYDKRTNRLTIINQKLRENETKLREYKDAKESHAKLTQELEDKLNHWKIENNRIIKEFDEIYLKSNIRLIWEDPIINLTEWTKKQFLDSDSLTKLRISKHYHMQSPVREDFVGEIIKELIIDKKYSLKRIIGNLENRKTPQLVESSGKEENLKWFFQRDATEILRENLIMRLQENAERGINLIQYKRKTLGKDNMSFGERCGTVVELILHSGDHPLIIDQPEEHLDGKFIANRVVEIIKEQKVNRQIIICTHNANIVVLGDSELTTVLSMSNQGTEYCQGSLEEPVIREKTYDVLEGGRIAFQKRERKYGFK